MVVTNVHQDQDASLLLDRHLLIWADVRNEVHLEHVRADFCGNVVHLDTLSATTIFEPSTLFFFCGDVARLDASAHFPRADVRVVRELSHNFDEERADLISVGAVPRHVHRAGVYFRELFPADGDVFAELTTAHRFQELKESNKPDSSHRKGIYLSEVTERDDGVAQFHLLRCSTNLNGPTDSFRDVDRRIIHRVNTMAKACFSGAAELNHVLAQVYSNSTLPAEQGGKEKKARIKSHSDKTKDMPPTGLIAFCTFYSNDIDAKGRRTDGDVVYKHGSVLTKLRFRLKPCVTDLPDLPKQFDVVLFPNSVFIIPLSTNRLYMHETVPPQLPVDRVPTRLGYVIRCSDTLAEHVDGVTYVLEKNGTRVKMEKPTEGDMAELRALYLAENTTVDRVIYGPIRYSMNDGDYLRPSA